MVPSAAETVHRYTKASEAFRREIRQNPEMAKSILLKAGIIVQDRSASSPSNVKLAKRFRSV